MALAKKPLETLPVPLGTVDRDTGCVVLDPQRTQPSVVAFVNRLYMREGFRTIHCYNSELFVWRDGHYALVEDGAIQKQLLTFLGGAAMYRFPKNGGPPALVPFKANPQTVNAVLDTLRCVAHIGKEMQLPAWLSPDRRKGNPTDFIAFKSSILHVPSSRVLPATPKYFTRTALPFEYCAKPAEPTRWLRFLDELFGEDMQSLELLQEWFGYVVTPDTSQQKALFIIGPKRSGKGTIGRVLRELVGPFNVVNPTTTGLAGTFGLQPLLGKSLATISDARFRGDHASRLTELILNITGEDPLTIDRKFLDGMTCKLGTRLMFFSNELPRLADASGALSSRFLVLKLDKSFYNQEDHNLISELLKELPGILQWALEGLKRLHKRGHFVQPKSAEESVQELEELGSPVMQFVRERCTLGVGHQAYINDLFNAWLSWCAEEGLDYTGTKSSFGRNLRAAVPTLKCRRGIRDERYYEGLRMN